MPRDELQACHRMVIAAAVCRRHTCAYSDRHLHQLALGSIGILLENSRSDFDSEGCELTDESLVEAEDALVT